MKEDYAEIVYETNDDKAAKKISWGDALRNVLSKFSKHYFVQKWQNAPIDMRFRLTNKCNENCARCFECSGPHQPLTVMPPKDVQFYNNNLTETLQDFCLTGGEWSLIYDVRDNYLESIYNGLELNHSDVYTIQTNATWVYGDKKNQILSDLKKIQTKLKPTGKILKLDTSVDRYRSKHSLKCVQELIRLIASDEEFDNTKIRILSCALDLGLSRKEVLQPEFFEKHNIKLDFEPPRWGFSHFMACYANHVRIVVHEEGPTMEIGRAKQNNIGYKIIWPEEQCGGLAPGHTCLSMDFREDGTVRWHDYYDWDITVPYKDKNGNYKPLQQIKDELIDKAWRKQLPHNMKRYLVGAIPGFGPLYTGYILRKIHKSMEENVTKKVYVAREINEK